MNTKERAEFERWAKEYWIHLLKIPTDSGGRTSWMALSVGGPKAVAMPGANGFGDTDVEAALDLGRKAEWKLWDAGERKRERDLQAAKLAERDAFALCEFYRNERAENWEADTRRLREAQAKFKLAVDKVRELSLALKENPNVATSGGVK
ncbi:MAG: hypothetical protein WCH99_12345 [Verrucomicrobiota bacterium]